VVILGPAQSPRTGGKRFEFIGAPSDADLALALGLTTAVDSTGSLETDKIKGTSNQAPMF